MRGLPLNKMGVAGHAVAQGRAGDNGHIQKSGVAQQLAQLRFFRQFVMEGSAVLTVARVDEDHRQISLQAFIQHGGQLLDVLLLLGCVLRLGQHQHIEVHKGGGVLHCQAEVVQMLRHDLC